MNRMEPDFHGQQIAVQAAVQKVMGNAASLMKGVSELLEVVNNPRMTIIIDPGMAPAQVQEEKSAWAKAFGVERLEDLSPKTPNQMFGGAAAHLDPTEGLPPSMKSDPTPAAPGDVSLNIDPAAVLRVESVLRANGVPFRRFGYADYILTDHVVTNDVRELFNHNFGGTPYSVNGLVSGQFADLRNRPDLFKPRPPLSPAAAEEVRNKVAGLEKPAAFAYGNTTIVSSTTDGIPPWMPEPPGGFDGATPMSSTTAGRKNDRIPNSGGEQ